MFGWIKKAVNDAGKGLVKGVNTVTKTVGQVPVVGGALKGTFTVIASPIKLTGNIANGRRLDRAVLDNFKDQLGAAKDLAPYAQTVLSVVPGLGTAASGAIGAGIALAQGQPITAALIAGVKGALPGGPAAKAIFDAAQSVAEGKPIDQVALSSIPGLTDMQQKSVAEALRISKDVANGKKVDPKTFANVINHLPPETQKALSVGVALGHGANLQKTVVKNVSLEDVKGFGSLGKKLAEKNPVIKAGLSSLSNNKLKTGFSVGVGLTANKLQPIQLIAARNKLPPEQKKGFDLAVSTRIGMVERKIPKSLKTPEEKFGYLATAGISGASVKNKTAMVKTIIKNPAAKKGAALAVKRIQDNAPWWKKLLKKLGLD